MNMHRWLPPLLFVAAGAGLGWLAAGQLRGAAEPAPAPAAAERAAPADAAKAADEIFEAPAGGFSADYVKTATVAQEQVPDAFSISGRLDFDAERLHLVSSRVAGRLDRILVFEGARVAAGQPLAELYSPDWIAAQKELQLARNTVRTLASAGQADLAADARATEEAARNRLQVLGAAPEDIARIEKGAELATHLPLRAPIAGTVTRRNMDPGAFLNVGDNFMTISDTSHIWFIGNVFENDYARVRLGQALEFEVPALPGRKFRGTISYIGTNIDPATHTLPIRCTVDNADGALRPQLFATASVTTGQREALVVPKSAIVSTQQTQVAIVEVAPNKYRRQVVTTRPLADERLAVGSGLKAGDRVVVDGASLLNEAMTSR